MEIKSIHVVPYDPAWPRIYADEARRLTEHLGALLVALHHIGSTSVPHLAAKPRIDIVAELRNPHDGIARIEALGYRYEGSWNMPLKWAFTKRAPFEFNLHTFAVGNAEIALNVMFRDYLRSHPLVRDQYASLKYELLQNPDAFVKRGFFTGYNLGKANFIRDVQRRTGFQGIRFVHPAHQYELEAFHEILADTNPHYQANTTHDKHQSIDPLHNVILLKGVDVVAAAQLRATDPKRLTILNIGQRQGYQGDEFMGMLREHIHAWQVRLAQEPM